MFFETFAEFMGREYNFIFTVAAFLVAAIGLSIAVVKIKDSKYKKIKNILILLIILIVIICVISAVCYIYYINCETSDWVLSTEVPSGVKIVDQKWVYVRTEDMDSENSNEPDWILIGSTWEIADSGTHVYAEFPVNSDGYEYYDYSDTYYKHYNVGAFTDGENERRKREVTDEQITSYIYYHWVYPLKELGEDNREIGEYKDKWISDGGKASIWESFENGYIEYNSEAKAYRASGHSGYSYWWNGRIPVYTQTYTDYVKIYHYIKESHLESPTEIKEDGDISNVQKLVRYRPK